MALLGLPHISSSHFLIIHHLQHVDIEIGLKTGSLKAAREKQTKMKNHHYHLYILSLSVLLPPSPLLCFLGPQGTHGIPS